MPAAGVPPLHYLADLVPPRAAGRQGLPLPPSLPLFFRPRGFRTRAIFLNGEPSDERASSAYQGLGLPPPPLRLNPSTTARRPPQTRTSSRDLAPTRWGKASVPRRTIGCACACPQ